MFLCRNDAHMHGFKGNEVKWGKTMHVLNLRTESDSKILRITEGYGNDF